MYKNVNIVYFVHYEKLESGTKISDKDIILQDNDFKK